MQFDIVPYPPPIDAWSTAAGSRRTPFEETTSIPFLQWMQQQALRSAPNPNRSRGTGKCRNDNEMGRLLGDENGEGLSAYAGSNEKHNRNTAYGLLIVIALASSVFLALGITLWRVNEGMSSIQEVLGPHTVELVNMTRNMMRSTSDTLEHINHAASHGDKLMTNPVLTMSLGGPRAPAGNE